MQVTRCTYDSKDRVGGRSNCFGLCRINGRCTRLGEQGAGRGPVISPHYGRFPVGWLFGEVSCKNPTEVYATGRSPTFWNSNFGSWCQWRWQWQASFFVSNRPCRNSQSMEGTGNWWKKCQIVERIFGKTFIRSQFTRTAAWLASRRKLTRLKWNLKIAPWSSIESLVPWK